MKLPRKTCGLIIGLTAIAAAVLQAESTGALSNVYSLNIATGPSRFNLSSAEPYNTQAMRDHFAPLRTTTYSVRSWVSFHAKL